MRTFADPVRPAMPASIHVGPWDLVLVAVVALQSTALAYVAPPRVKSIFLTLPFPFTVVTLAVGLPVDAANVLAMFLLLAYIHGVRLLHDGLGVPIVAAIALALGGYCAAGWLLADLVPSGAAAFWPACAAVFAVGAIVLATSAPRAERAHRTRLPVWQKLPAVLAVVCVLVVVKQELRGFATLFPLVGVVGAYESRHCLWTMGLTAPALMVTLVPMMAVVYLTQGHLGLLGALGAGWVLFLALLLPLMRWQWRRWPAPLAASLLLCLLPAGARAAPSTPSTSQSWSHDRRLIHVATQAQFWLYELLVRQQGLTVRQHDEAIRDRPLHL